MIASSSCDYTCHENDGRIAYHPQMGNDEKTFRLQNRRRRRRRRCRRRRCHHHFSESIESSGIHLKGAVEAIRLQ